ncbi:MAG TPA: hydrolase 2, exosortase A system-associated [Casimicrobiaceae bacterium]|nr:hydrolase 2, exosortase A system-associated [Casimicrobiaceae bacterium]
MSREAFLVEGEGGDRFCLLTRAHAPVRGSMLYVHPFAEEMNKSRRMAACASAAFADRGWNVLQPDLFGCGDSAGAFGEATWQRWIEDVDRAWTWLCTHCPGPHLLWGLRAGALLLSDWLAIVGHRAPLLLWQPVVSGKQHLAQFLRLKAAGEMLADADGAQAVARVRAELAAGRAVEIAGYEIAPALAEGLSAAALRLPPGARGPIAVLETAMGDLRQVSPALDRLVREWRGAGHDVGADTASGPPFWQTLEIEVAPDLVARSLAWLDTSAA